MRSSQKREISNKDDSPSRHGTNVTVHSIPQIANMKSIKLLINTCLLTLLSYKAMTPQHNNVIHIWSLLTNLVFVTEGNHWVF